MIKKTQIWSVQVPEGTTILKLKLPTNTRISAIQEVNHKDSYVLLDINVIQWEDGTHECETDNSAGNVDADGVCKVCGKTDLF
jgi:hypothetical protein